MTSGNFFLTGNGQVAVVRGPVQLPPGVPAGDDLHQRPTRDAQPAPQCSQGAAHRGGHLHHRLDRRPAQVLSSLALISVLC